MKNELFKHCEDCPCYSLLTEKRKKQILRWNELFDDNLSKIKEVKFILLGESIPNNRYFYDKQSDYKDSGLRYVFREELNMSSDDELFLYLQEKGIVIVDCAFCALHLLQKKSARRRHSATYCLLNYKKELLLKYTDTHIVSFFPSKCGLLKRQTPDIKIEEYFPFPKKCDKKKPNRIVEYMKRIK